MKHQRYHHSRDPHGDRHKFNRYRGPSSLLDIYRAYLPLWADYVLIPLAIGILATFYYYDKCY